MLVLKFDKFAETRDKLSPETKSSDLIGKDLYLMKRTNYI
jgi:hypothetical protein